MRSLLPTMRGLSPGSAAPALAAIGAATHAFLQGGGEAAVRVAAGGFAAARPEHFGEECGPRGGGGAAQGRKGA